MKFLPAMLFMLLVYTICSPVQARPATAAKNDRGVALADAVRSNNVAKARALLEKGADPDGRNSQGSPVLVIAASRGYTAVVQALLKRHPDINARSKDGGTALCEAAMGGYTSIVNALLAAGANVNAADAYGITPLIAAAQSGSLSITRALLARGANTRASIHGLESTALHFAANGGNVEIVRALLGAGAPVDMRSWLGTTPLMEAASNGHVETVKVLLAHRADPTARDDAKRRVYAMAWFVPAAALPWPVPTAADVRVRREDGISVLDCAQSGGNKEIILLIKRAFAKKP